MISFACSSCGKQLKVKDEGAGKKVKCPGCGSVIAVLDRVPSLTAGASLSGRPETPTLPPDAPSNPPTQGTIPPPGLSDATDTSHPHADQHDASLIDFLAPPQADDEMGRLGGFRILKVLGHGGMGVVFQGEDPKLGRKVAIKAMLPHLADSKTSQQRFLREARAAAALEHDHIVAIHHVGEDRGAPFIVMPFLKGEPLDVRLQREGRLPVAEVLRIGREIAAGLGVAHAAGLIHRDIKPANVWLEEPHGRVKILDFGLARASVGDSGLTQQGAIIGTPAYMAPEQASGEAVDGRCDLFSLGCVLYRMATGQAAFKGKDTVSTLMSVAIDNPPPPVQLRPEVPEALSDLVMQLLAKKPEERTQSAQAVVDALRQIEGDATQVLATPGAGSGQGNVASTKREAARTSMRRQGSKRSRLPWLIGGSVAGVCVLVAALVLLWPTPKGTVRIESDDPNVEIVFDKTGPTIKGADKEPISLRAGEHGVLIKRGDFTFEADKFLLKKGEAVVLRLELLQGKVEIVQDGQVVASRDVSLPFDPTDSCGSPFPALDRDWVKKVQALPPAKQVEAVAAELKRRNPGFDGKVELKGVAGSRVTEVDFWSEKVEDLSPLRALTGLRTLRCNNSLYTGSRLMDLSPLKGMKLSTLQCFHTPVSDLSPLKGMKLTILRCGRTRVSDLSPLKGMPLTELDCGSTPVSDLSPLKGMPLTALACGATRVSDLSPLKGMPLTELNIQAKSVTDLSPLAGMRLRSLNFNETQVTDLSPLKGMPLTVLHCGYTKVTDLSPLAGMPLTYLDYRSTQVSDVAPLKGLPLQAIECHFKPERDAAILRSIKTLERINNKPAAQFWKEVDAKAANKKP